MHPDLIESMRDQARAIYRIVTGNDMPERQVDAETAPPLQEVTRSFAELEALARTIPTLAQRVAPVAFTPTLDAFPEGDDLVLEIAVPGIDREDVAVECENETLIISGVSRKRGEAAAASYSHAEIPHGPFYRTFQIPFPSQDPAVDLDRGLLRVRLKRSTAKPRKEEASRKRQQSSTQQSTPQQSTPQQSTPEGTQR